MIPAERINAVGRNVASIYPLPNGAGNFNNYTSTVNRETNDNAYSARVDHRFSGNDSFFARFNYGKFSSTRRRARPPAACRRRPRPPHVSISDRSSPAFRTHG